MNWRSCSTVDYGGNWTIPNWWRSGSPAFPKSDNLSQVIEWPKCGEEGTERLNTQVDNGQIIYAIPLWPTISAAIGPEGSKIGQWLPAFLIFALASNSGGNRGS